MYVPRMTLWFHRGTVWQSVALVWLSIRVNRFLSIHRYCATCCPLLPTSLPLASPSPSLALCFVGALLVCCPLAFSCYASLPGSAWKSFFTSCTATRCCFANLSDARIASGRAWRLAARAALITLSLNAGSLSMYLHCSQRRRAPCASFLARSGYVRKKASEATQHKRFVGLPSSQKKDQFFRILFQLTTINLSRGTHSRNSHSRNSHAMCGDWYRRTSATF